MLIIQNIYNSSPPRTFATEKTGDKETGLRLGEKVQIYEKGNTLFYSHDHTLAESAGFGKIAQRKVFYTQNRAQVALPLKWFAEYCNGITHLRAYYTEIGLFLRPFYKG